MLRFVLPAAWLRLGALLAITTAACWPQIQTGRLSGTVYDASRRVVPNASVTVVNTSTNITRQVSTDESGNYLLPTLNPGTYEVAVTAPGFRTTRRPGVEMQVGKDLLLDVELQVGETATSIEVTAEVPLLNSESGNLGHVMTNRQIVDLPLNGRGFSDLARLTPGVVQLPGTGNVTRIRPEAVNGTTISGVRGRQVSFYLDGADTSEQHQGGSWIQTSIDALQEFSVQQNAYSAEHSRSGSFFNAITKSGTNRVHGAVYEFLRNEKLDSRNFFARDRARLKRNQFGAAVGGPVVLPKIYNGSNRTVLLLQLRGYARAAGERLQPHQSHAGDAAGRLQHLAQRDLRPQHNATESIRYRRDPRRIPEQSHSSKPLVEPSVVLQSVPHHYKYSRRNLCLFSFHCGGHGSNDFPHRSHIQRQSPCFLPMEFE
jgi:hypothetical protein